MTSLPQILIVIFYNYDLTLTFSLTFSRCLRDTSYTVHLQWKRFDLLVSMTLTLFHTLQWMPSLNCIIYIYILCESIAMKRVHISIKRRPKRKREKGKKIIPIAYIIVHVAQVFTKLNHIFIY